MKGEKTPDTPNTMQNSSTVHFDYYMSDSTLIQGESDNLEEVILNYRRELKRRSKADRPERGTLRYKIGNGGEWVSA